MALLLAQVGQVGNSEMLQFYSNAARNMSGAHFMQLEQRVQWPSP